MSQQPYDEVVLSAYKQRLESAKEEPWLAGIRLRQGEPLGSRFQRHYERLAALPRRTRRRLQRRLAMSLAALALMLALSGAPQMGPHIGLQAAVASGDVGRARMQEVRGRGIGELPLSVRPERNWEAPWAAPVLPGAPAATIVVNGNDPLTDCTLPDAIVAANTDTATGNCTAGSGADIVDIQVNVDLTAPAPSVDSEMTLAGNGNAISGDNTFGPLLQVSATGDLTLNNATVQDGNNPNLVDGFGGGLAIYYGSAEVNESTFTNNYALRGGAMMNVHGSLSVTDSVITGNSAYSGAGIRNYGPPGADTIITGSTISDNVAFEGAGLRNSFDCSFIVIDSTITGNHADASGGGIQSPGDENGAYGNYLRLENSTISNNTTDEYAAGIDSFNNATLVVVNSTISGNASAGSYGGGIYSGYLYPSSLTITDSTITGNSANSAGAGVLMANGESSISRSIISGNTGTSYSEVYNVDTLTVDDHNLFGHDGLTTAQAIGGFAAGATDILATSDGTLPTALTTILDTTLADNGGPTETHALPDMFSPAVNGALVGCADGMVDQRGEPRGMGPGMGGPLCDIGAFELQGAPPTDVSLSGFGGEAGGGGFVAGVVAAATAAAMAALAAAGMALRRRVKPR